MNDMKNVRRLILCSAMAVMLGCDDDGAAVATKIPSPAPSPAPLAPVVLEQIGGGLPAHTLALIPFDSPVVGTLDITVDWTSAANDVQVYLARGDCAFERFINGLCTVVAYSESTAKPERLTVTAAMGRHTLGIGNAGDGDDSVTLRVVLQPGTSASGAATAATAAQGKPVGTNAFFRAGAIRPE
jgi:hypothetical protein